jgi:hypothetical protein
VLSDHEQQAWRETVRCFDVEAEEPVRVSGHATHRRTRESHGLDEMAVGGLCVAIMLVFIGAPVVGLVVGGVTALGWLLWRPLPHLSTTTVACALLLRGDVKGASDAGEGAVETPGPDHFTNAPSQLGPCRKGRQTRRPRA